MLYNDFVFLYEKLDSTSKRLEKTFYVSELLKKTPDEELERAILMVEGKLFPEWEDKKIGISSKLAIKAISKTTGMRPEEIEIEWKNKGDLGDVAEFLTGKKKQSSLFPRQLKLKEVFDNLRSLASEEGKGSVDVKMKVISELLVHASPKESKYLIRTIVDNLRVGIGKGSIRDAIVWSYFLDKIDYEKEKNSFSVKEGNQEEYDLVLGKVQEAYDLTGDLAKVALLLRQKGIKGISDVSLEIDKPVNLMLFQKAKDIEDAFSIVGKPAAFEYKYDGFRMQIHKKGTNIKIFTRRLEDVTAQFPEIIKPLIKNISADECILDAEAVGFDPKTGKYLPFQNISQRIKRKYEIQELSERFPVEINIFDILYLNGKSLLNIPFKDRRDSLKKIISEEEKKVVLSKQIITSDFKEAKLFYEESLKKGEEGVMAKNLEGIYKPGSRVGYGVKIKPIMDPLDLVIVAAEYGEGKRSGWLTSFNLACSNDSELREIGKVSTGLKELEEEGTTFLQLTNLLKPFIKKGTGKIVEIIPEIVIEVGYEEIQASQSYSSGFALRFPRFLRLRTDEKTVEDISTLDEVRQLYLQQRGRGKTDK